MQDIRPDTPVSFAPDPEDLEDADFGGAAAGPAVGLDEEISMDIMENTTMQDVLKLWPWVNQTPLTVSPQLPLEIAMQLFKRQDQEMYIVDYGIYSSKLQDHDACSQNDTVRPLSREQRSSRSRNVAERISGNKTVVQRSEHCSVISCQRRQTSVNGSQAYGLISGSVDMPISAFSARNIFSRSSRGSLLTWERVGPMERSVCSAIGSVV